jgi:DNA-binding HxlR family transcriptional regulator
VLDRLGNRWTTLVLHELSSGTVRFNTLKARIGDVSQRMLAQTLRHLEQDGLVTRVAFPTIPPRVEYSLTPLGRTLLVPLEGMLTWAVQHQAAVNAARLAYQAREAESGDVQTA